MSSLKRRRIEKQRDDDDPRSFFNQEKRDAIKLYVPPGDGPTVIVACKVPSGVLLQLCQPAYMVEQGPGGRAKKVKIMQPVPKEFDRLTRPGELNGGEFRLRGSALPMGIDPRIGLQEFRKPIRDGYALSTVPRSYWEEWVAQHWDFPLLASRAIFAHASKAAVVDQASEQRDEGVVSGFEPLDPDLIEEKDSEGNRVVIADNRLAPIRADKRFLRGTTRDDPTMNPDRRRLALIDEDLY